MKPRTSAAQRRAQARDLSGVATESEIQTLIRLAVSKIGVVAFRNNVGTGWIGRVFRVTVAQPVLLKPRDVVIRNARPLHAGLIAGSSDLVGWKSVEITPDMVGRRVAVFWANECKTPDGRVSTEQEVFLSRLRADGGIAVLARSEREALEGIEKWNTQTR